MGRKWLENIIENLANTCQDILQSGHFSFFLYILCEKYIHGRD